MKKKKLRYFKDLSEKYRGEGILPRCGHFGECGGCLFQDIPYEGQLNLKKDYLNALFNGYAEIDSVKGSIPFGYRNRMDMVTAFGKIGQRRANRFREVIDIESCSIMQNISNCALKKIRPMTADIEDYDYCRHEGYLRYVVFRQTMFTNMLMINFVTSRTENGLSSIIDAIYDTADSISLICHDGLADLSFGMVFENIKGCGIIEDFDGIKFLISPNSFFQSNSAVSLDIYRRIKEFVRGRVLDLYSGVGSISLFVAESCEIVTGVELVPEAVKMAEHNREINRIKNTDFVCDDARKFISEKNGEFDCAVLDPPRSGMHPKVLKEIIGSGIERLIYLSCNPQALKQDMDILCLHYNIVSFEAYDMFPQTPHVESLVVFDRK